MARLLFLLMLLAAVVAARADEAIFFDDFSHANLDALRAAGWTLRERAGHPGVPGAQWRADAIELIDDVDRRGNRLLRLSGQTDGTPGGTVQSQLCHARKVLHGTYAARVRFANEPLSGDGGDPVIQSFYAVAPLRFDFDPEFSEIDWEYLAQGGWGSPAKRLYAITWQTVRIEPWQAYNQAHERIGALAPRWHTLLMQSNPQGTRWFLDGHPLARHGGRHVPVVPMAISFSLWFSPGGLAEPTAAPRRWAFDVDWVFHAAGQALSPAQVDAKVRSLRARAVAAIDEVLAETPPLESRCDF
jgi:hypothetical protein